MPRTAKTRWLATLTHRFAASTSVTLPNVEAENLSLVLADGSDLTVTRFVATEVLSSPYDVDVTAITTADNLSFEAIVGHKASFRAAGPWAFAAPRMWTGIVHRIEQMDAEPNGATTYSIRLAPALYCLTRRTNCRIFQHLSIPEIALALLAEWEIVPTLRLDVASFPRHEYRVQYAETDLAFLSRLLEEAGITYFFEDPETPKNEGEQPWSQLVLAEDVTRRELRKTSPEYWNTKDLPNDREAICEVRARREVRSGRATLRDFDYRARPKHKLFATQVAASGTESRLETYEYIPGAFVIEPTKDSARVDEREAQVRADRALSANRNRRFAVTYRANILDLSPGSVLTFKGHPHPELSDKKPLLVTAQTIHGKADGEWIVRGEATYGDEPHRPARITPRPNISGVQSAFVVGPEGEEIHTDAMGRVRIELPWDREGKSDEKSSCFVRVSQSWAGPGYGMVAIPRVGEEVLVSFFEGDPDQPVVVGRVHNGAAPPPQALPQNKTKSIWRTSSTPGGGGFSEIAIDDKKGEEVIAVRAERDYERTVLREERALIGASLTTDIGASEMRSIEVDQTIQVGGNRNIVITGNDALRVGESLSIDLGGGAGGTFSKDKRIVFTTGEASLVLDGPNVYIDAKAVLSLRSGDALTLSGGNVSIDGQPNINLNGSSASAPSVSQLGGGLLNLLPQLPVGAPPVGALYQLVSSPLFDPGQAPGELSLPPELEAQLAAARNKILAGIEEIITKVENAPDLIGQDVLPEVEAAYAAALARIEEIRKWVEQVKATIAAEIEKWKAEALALKARLEAAIENIKAKIQEAIATVSAKIKEIRDKARELLQSVKDSIAEFKDKIKSEFEYWKAQAIEFKNKVVGPFEEIRNNIKELTQEVKDTISEFKETVTGIVDDVKNGVKEVKETVQEVKDFLNDPFGIKEMKKDVKETIQGVKDAFSDAKQEAKEALDEVKDLLGGESGSSLFSGENQLANQGGFKTPTGNIPGQGGNSPKLPGSGKVGSGGGGTDFQKLARKVGQAADGHVSSPNPLAGSTLVTRSGGLTPRVLADAVNAADAPALLQSPGEGQLLVVRTQQAAALSTEELTQTFVDGQMDGLTPSDAYTAALNKKGYLVYERPWDGFLVSFLKKAVL